MRRVAMGLAGAAALMLAGCDNNPFVPGPKPPAAGKNQYSGNVKAEFMVPATPADYYRDMKLLEAFSYTDPDGVVWEVPAGSITNGASVPWGFWNIVGGPYDGPYRDAAVIHDFYVEKKSRTWEDTNRMFYYAMLARGVSDTLSRTMYAGVRYGGPRWDVVQTPAPAKAQAVPSITPETQPTPDAAPAAPAARVPAPSVATPLPTASPAEPLAPAEAPAPPVRSLGRSLATDQELKTFDDLRRWIEKEKPSLDEIDRMVEQMRKNEGKSTVTP